MMNFNLYRSTSPTDGFTLLASLPTDSTYYEDHSVTNGTRYYYKVTTMYFHGESVSPRTATALPMTWLDSAPVLLVDDDGSGFMNAPDVFDAYASALTELGVPFNAWEVCCTLGMPGPSAGEMDDFNAVIWFTGIGARDGWTVTEDDEMELREYIDGGGRFALFSPEYVWDRYDTLSAVLLGTGDFLYDYFQITGINQDAWRIDSALISYFNLNGTSAGFASGQSFGVGSPYVPNVLFPDYIISHSATPLLTIRTAGTEMCVAVSTPIGSKCVFSTYPFEAMINRTEPSTRTEFMRRMLYDYFDLFGSGDTAVTAVLTRFCRMEYAICSCNP